RYPVHVDCVECGGEALKAAARQQYQLVLLDLQMPDMDGFATARRLRKIPGYERVPILALTANFSDETHDRCHPYGMQAYIAKPVQAGELWATISKFLH